MQQNQPFNKKETYMEANVPQIDTNSNIGISTPKQDRASSA